MIFKNLLHAYRNSGIQIKLTICVIVAAAIPALAIGVMFSGRLYSMVISDTIKDQQLESDAVAPQISDAISEITDAAATLCDDKYYKSLFFATVERDYVSLAQTDAAASFSDTVQDVIDTTPVSAVKIYVDLPGDYSDFFKAEASKDVFLPESKSRGTYWHGIFNSAQVSTLYCPSLYLSPGEISNYGDCAYIYRTSTTHAGETYTAYVALYFSSDVFASIMDNGITVNDSVSYIINERNATVSTTNAKLSGMYYQYYDNLKDYLMSSNSFLEKEIVGRKVYIAINYIKEANWFMVTVTPEEPLIKSANRAALTFVLIYLAAIIIAVTIAVVQTRSITVRLSKLNTQMAKVRSEYPKPLPEPTIHDEVGELILTYNYMTREMDRLVAKQEQTAEELKMSEFNALQAQINPHFLYNMMDVINWMVLSGKPAEASNTIQQLAKFYKLTLSQKKNIGTIKEELEHVNIYIELQNMRFSNRFDFVIDMPDELVNYQIPKLTLQPIVENSILHGIMEKEDKTGTIVITGWEENEDIYILISDDGIGIPEDILPNILSCERKKISSGTNIAVYNIHNRLQLLYGPGYGLTYESTYHHGCDVTIKIPKLSV